MSKLIQSWNQHGAGKAPALMSCLLVTYAIRGGLQQTLQKVKWRIRPLWQSWVWARLGLDTALRSELLNAQISGFCRIAPWVFTHACKISTLLEHWGSCCLTTHTRAKSAWTVQNQSGDAVCVWRKVFNHFPKDVPLIWMVTGCL